MMIMKQEDGKSVEQDAKEDPSKWNSNRVRSMLEKEQGLTSAAITANHTNGKAERRKQVMAKGSIRQLPFRHNLSEQPTESLPM